MHNLLYDVIYIVSFRTDKDFMDGHVIFLK